MQLLSIIPDRIFRALSNTFICSLWQGVVLAVVAGLVVLLTRRSSPGKRYNLLVGSLALFAAAVLGTFMFQYSLAGDDDSGITEATAPKIMAMGSQTVGQTGLIRESGSSLLDYIDTHAGSIVLIWFLVVCARCIQLLTGLHGLHRMRREAVTPGADWEQRVQELADMLGIRQHIMFAESAVARVPMVIGHFKPVILIPAALLAAMSPAEIEAVLIHELAHIRRRDYLVNMLQHLMEIVFFFNPAVMWVSSLIKTERENCCDDITLGHTNNKTAYIRALISCQEFQSQTPQMVVGLTGRSNLLGRVNRMVSSSNHSLSIVEKSLLTGCLVAGGILLAAFTGEKEAGDQSAKPVLQPFTTIVKPAVINSGAVYHSVPDVFRVYQPAEVGEGTSCYIGNVGDKPGYKTYILKRDNVLYQLNYIKDTLVSLQVGGKNIPSSNWASYSEKVHRLAKEYNRKMDDTFDHPDRTDDSDIFGAAEKTLSAGAESTLRSIDKVGMALGRSMREIKAAADSLRRRDYEATKRDYYSTDNTAGGTGQPFIKKEYGSQPVPVYQEYKSAYTGRNAFKKDPQTGDAAPRTRNNWITVDELIAHLVEEGIVKKAEDVKSFMLTPQQMIMNDKKMPEAIHRMVLDRYVRADSREKWTMYYNFDTSTIKSITRNGINAG